MSQTSRSEIFQETFDAYFWKCWLIIGVLYLVAFSLYTVLICRGLYPESPAFSELLDGLGTWLNNINFMPLSIGYIAVGAVTVGIVSIGACSIGIVAVGACSIGIVAFGPNAVGIIAIGAGTSYGLLGAPSVPRGRFDIGKVVGVIAIGPDAYGLYTLSYGGDSRYAFSPEHQDTAAVALFTRWLPKFKKMLSPL